MNERPNALLHRHSIRLKGYDYTKAGFYFVTLVTEQRMCRFGEIVDGSLRLNAAGMILQQELAQTPQIRPGVLVDESIIMPNHLHVIFEFVDVGEIQPTGESPSGSEAHSGTPLQDQPPGLRRPARSLGALVAGIKAAVTKKVNILEDSPGKPLWQRNYYERIIRNDRELDKIRQYIRENPARWEADTENPVRRMPAM